MTTVADTTSIEPVRFLMNLALVSIPTSPRGTPFPLAQELKPVSRNRTDSRYIHLSSSQCNHSWCNDGIRMPTCFRLDHAPCHPLLQSASTETVSFDGPPMTPFPVSVSMKRRADKDYGTESSASLSPSRCSLPSHSSPSPHSPNGSTFRH